MKFSRLGQFSVVVDNKPVKKSKVTIGLKHYVVIAKPSIPNWCLVIESGLEINVA
jgi:hypothetical protein